jgi:diaminohydroxyphosphoribosylaminopyrimidine deaminase/5-amino-6-(5-phosphoribosylamino)uracil reductase
MGHALRLAGRGLYTTDPNPRVGCVLVRGEAVVGEGWHARAGGPHAEIHALRAAGDRAVGATAYVTLEPCCHHGRTPPCTDALIAAGVQRVVAAMEDPNPRVGGAGLKALQAAGIEVRSGVLAAEAQRLNPGFVMRMRQGRPWVRCKLAMSLDGRTAMASGESRWITGEAARRDAHRWRARSSAVMTGVGTVLADDPSLTVRLEADDTGPWRQPLRVILDTQLRTPSDARLLGEPGETLILAGVRDGDREARLQGDGVSIVALPMAGGRLDLAAVMRHLGRMEINEVHLEAGATLSGALLAAGWVDELVIYLASHLLGDAARGLFTLPGLERMDQRIELSRVDIRAVGRDWRITAIVNKGIEVNA